MVSKIIEKRGKLCCSNCLMRLQTITPYCQYCGDNFSNYEEIITKIFMRATEPIPQELIDAFLNNEGEKSNI